MENKIIKAEIIHKARAFGLYKEKWQLVNGRVSTFSIIHHPGSVAIVPLLDDDKIVMEYQFRASVKANIWEIPAGTLEIGEEAKECAKRELIEEIGYQAEKIIPLGEILLAPGYSDEKMKLFLAEGLTPCDASPDADEIIQAVPISIDKVITMIKDGEILDAGTIVALFKFFSIRGIEI